jgi:hypothetical protein
VAAGTLAFYAGGDTPSGVTDTVDIYDSATGSWSRGALSQPRADAIATVVGHNVLFAGGTRPDAGANGSFSDVVDIYDLLTGTWAAAKLSQRREVSAVATIGDLAIFAGGRTGKTLASSTQSNVIDIYNVATGRWSTGRLSNASDQVVAASVGTVALFATDNAFANRPAAASVDLYTQTERFLAASSIGA